MMPSLTAEDMASRSDEPLETAHEPMKKARKGWVNRNDTSDETDDAAEVAAERTRKSVKNPRKPGAMTMIPEAFGFAPLVATTVVKDVAKKAKKLYDRKYDERFKDEED